MGDLSPPCDLPDIYTLALGTAALRLGFTYQANHSGT